MGFFGASAAGCVSTSAPKRQVPLYEFEEPSYFVQDEAELFGLNAEEMVRLYKITYRCPQPYVRLLDYRVDRISDSAPNEETALLIAREMLHNGPNTPIEAYVDYEEDLYYVIHVAWNHFDNYNDPRRYDTDLVCFKSEYVDYVARRHWLGIEFAMTIRDFSTIQTFLDLHEFIGRYQKLLFSKVTETEEGYLYCDYQLEAQTGDWGLEDTIQLVRRTWQIGKSGVVGFAGEEIINSFTGEWWI